MNRPAGLPRRALLRSAGLLALACPSLARAAWPASVMRFVVPFAPGGALDVPARMLAERLGPALGATIVVENRAGAGGGIGAQAVAQATADGSTFLFTSSSVTILPALNPALGLDPERGLAPISLVCDMPAVLLVKHDSRFADLAALLAFARANPGRLTYASGGVGSANHLAGAAFASLAGIDMVHVPYRGMAPVLTAIQAGEIDLAFAPTLDVLGQVRQGRLRVLGQSLPERVASLPGVPTIAEHLPGYAAPNWFAVFGPAALPAALRDQMAGALAPLRDWPALRDRFEAGAARLRLDGPAPLAERLREDVPRWAALVSQLGIRPD